MKALRADLRLIADLVPAGCRLLDIGCGDGELIAYLSAAKRVDARGIELSMPDVAAAVARGASVVQGDADTDLIDYPADAFDVAILSRTLQATQRPDAVLRQMLRIARMAIVSFPNFGHWRARLSLGLGGRMPMSAALPTPWYETKNIHLCTIRDFLDLCGGEGHRIDRAIHLAAGRPLALDWLANARAEEAVFVLSRGSR